MIARILFRTVATVVVTAVLVFVADSILWQVRMMHGKGFDTVEVDRMSVATLKSHKEEYYFEGKDSARCSHSAFPMPTSQGVFTPCWWMKDHHSVVTRY